MRRALQGEQLPDDSLFESRFVTPRSFDAVAAPIHSLGAVLSWVSWVTGAGAGDEGERDELLTTTPELPLSESQGTDELAWAGNKVQLRAMRIVEQCQITQVAPLGHDARAQPWGSPLILIAFSMCTVRRAESAPPYLRRCLHACLRRALAALTDPPAAVPPPSLSEQETADVATVALRLGPPPEPRRQPPVAADEYYGDGFEVPYGRDHGRGFAVDYRASSSEEKWLAGFERAKAEAEAEEEGDGAWALAALGGGADSVDGLHEEIVQLVAAMDSLLFLDAADVARVLDAVSEGVEREWPGCQVILYPFLFGRLARRLCCPEAHFERCRCIPTTARTQRAARRVFERRDFSEQSVPFAEAMRASCIL